MLLLLIRYGITDSEARMVIQGERKKTKKKENNTASTTSTSVGAPHLPVPSENVQPIERLNTRPYNLPLYQAHTAAVYGGLGHDTKPSHPK